MAERNEELKGVSGGPAVLAEAALPAFTNRLTPRSDLVTGGQPRAEDFPAFAEAGVRLVVDTRDPREWRGFEEAAVVEAAGMEYVNIPMRSLEASFDAMRSVLRDGRRPALVHCGSGNRVGGLMVPYLILDEGMEPRAAVELAARIGLRSQILVDQAMAYVDRQTE